MESVKVSSSTNTFFYVPIDSGHTTVVPFGSVSSGGNVAESYAPSTDPFTITGRNEIKTVRTV